MRFNIQQRGGDNYFRAGFAEDFVFNVISSWILVECQVQHN
jgi:hypothetical protein